MTTSDSPADVAMRILRRSLHLSIPYLTCTYHEGVLTISGRLPSFHLKQVAQTEVQDIAGVDRIDNKVEVPV